nr:MAG TPA: outer membrane protein assembly factor [Caudoviricetes sp.]
MKVYQCKRSKLAWVIGLLCIFLSGCTAHTINNNVSVGICVKAL